MRTSLRILLFCGLVAMFGVSSYASSYTLTFDDLPNPDRGAVIPDGYGNLNWVNAYYLDGTLPLYSGSGYENGITSGTNVAYNGFADTASAYTNPGVVLSLVSGYFTSAWFTQVAEIDTYVGGSLTGAFVFPALFSQPTWIDFGGVQFDQMLIYSDPGSQLVIDDLTLATPEPTSMFLLGGGALAVCHRLRKRKA